MTCAIVVCERCSLAPIYPYGGAQGQAGAGSTSCAHRMQERNVMKIQLSQSEIGLQRRQTFSLADGAGVRIAAREGTVWVTQDHDLRDVILHPGEAIVSIGPARDRAGARPGTGDASRRPAGGGGRSCPASGGQRTGLLRRPSAAASPGVSGRAQRAARRPLAGPARAAFSSAGPPPRARAGLPAAGHGPSCARTSWSCRDDRESCRSAPATRGASPWTLVLSELTATVTGMS